MRALSLLEPWATLVALGLKTVETRKHPVGLTLGEEFAVHASRGQIDPGLYRDVLRWAGLERIEEQPGKLVAIARVLSIEESDGGMALGWLSQLHGEERDAARDREYKLGNFAAGRTLYVLDARRLHKPLYARGMPGVWKLDPAVERELIGAGRAGRAWG